MTKIAWDRTGERFYETGVDRGVLYLPNAQGLYTRGFGWNGLTAVNESPEGGESNKQYADNIVYLNLISAEEFNFTIEAFTYPDEFMQCDGTAQPVPGLLMGQQSRYPFGFSYRTKIANDLDPDLGYYIHLVYQAMAAPSEKNRTTINDSPEASAFSWECSTTPVDVPGVLVNGRPLRPTAHLQIDTRKFSAAKIAEIENILYGTTGEDPRLPQPVEIISLLTGDQIEVRPQAPTYDDATNTITIPSVTGVSYSINGEEVSGSIVIDEDTLVVARPNTGYRFPPVVDVDWLFEV